VRVAGLESKKLGLDYAECSLVDVIHQATGDVSALTDQSQTDICCLLDPSLPERVISDAGRLRSLLADLIAATVESVSSQQVKVSVFSSIERQPEVEITFEMTALRPSTESQRANGLKPPVVADPELSSSVLRQVQSLGGDVGVQVQQGSAPVFWCRIPVQYPVQQETEESDRPSSGGGPTLPLSGKQPIRMLMAEDNSINQRVGKLILQKAGYRIDLVSDGSEAVDAHQKSPYDVILMDCQMPTMDGFEATRRIRSAGLRQPVIIAVTANALVGERERCLAAGMDDYLSKPFQAEQLVAIVEKWAEEAIRR
jgi:CheY-like chemotaxis protein